MGLCVSEEAGTSGFLACQEDVGEDDELVRHVLFTYSVRHVLFTGSEECEGDYVVHDLGGK